MYSFQPLYQSQPVSKISIDHHVNNFLLSQLLDKNNIDQPTDNEEEMTLSSRNQRNNSNILRTDTFSNSPAKGILRNSQKDILSNKQIIDSDGRSNSCKRVKFKI